MFGIDYAYGRPPMADLRSAGVKFVCRYLSLTPPKNLSPLEAQTLTTNRIDIIVVWETSARRALLGESAGRSDAMQAQQQAQACGQPPDRPIYFAVDFDATYANMPKIMEYLDGAASVLGHNRIGIYGGYVPVKSAMDQGVKWGWQTYAWSGGRWDPRAQLQQYSNGHTIGGVDCDYDRAMHPDYGQWRIGHTPNPPHQEDDDMPNGQLNPITSPVTPISLPPAAVRKYTRLGLVADNGLQKAPAVNVRVATHTTDKKWHVSHVKVDSAFGQTVVSLPPNCDGISLEATMADGTTPAAPPFVPVAWTIW